MGEWSRGTFLDVELLKEQLGVSKQPVMDALHRLSADGLLEIIPQVGCRVPTYTSEETQDFFAMFASLEGESTAVAARRRTEAQVELLVAINDKIGGLSSAEPSVGEYFALNRRFHLTLLEMTHSALVMQVSGRMWDACDLILTTTGATRLLTDEIDERHADHQRIISALRHLDAGAAREEMRQHILRNIPLIEAVRQGS